MIINNTDWIKELKHGDKVAYDSGKFGRTQYNIVTVEKITPSGIIKTSDGYSWSKEGRQRGVSSTGWDMPYFLKPLTQEIRDAVEKEIGLVFIGKTNFRNLPLDALKQIVGIIKLY